MILVLIPNGNTDTRGIGILESLWKVLEVIIYTRLRESFCLHDALHEFRAVMGTRAVVLDLKLAQDLDRVNQDPFFLVFLDLLKAYYTVYRGRLLTTLEGYRTSPHMCKLLVVFWYQHEFVAHQNRCHGLYFKTTRGTTQVRIVSPTLFNLIVYNMVCNWLALMVDDQLSVQEGLGLALGRCLVIFYANGGMVESRDPDWLQGNLNVIIGIFCRYGLVMNVTKSKVMICQPGALQSGMSEEVVGWRCTGRGYPCQYLLI